MAQSNELVMLALGGLGEIGRNMMLYGWGPSDDRHWLMVDCGIGFAGADMPGVDIILPDIGFIWEERRRLEGIVITHAHEDHYGALTQWGPMLDVPIYMTPFAAGMLQAKMSEMSAKPELDIRQIRQEERVQIGVFDVEFLPVAHSIPESCALAIRAGERLFIHSGDWKIDEDAEFGKPFNPERWRALGAEGVDALICDSTNVMRDGVSPSSREVAESLGNIIAKAPNRVVVTTFASNLSRIRTVALHAIAAGRTPILLGRSLKRLVGIARECGYLSDIPEFAGEDEFLSLPRDKVLAIATGSQGEARAAMARIAEGSYRGLALDRDDLVIFSSRTIPGNELAVNHVINSLSYQGIKVITDQDQLVHVSGHPRQGEVEQLYKLLKPKCVLPAHGEALHLRRHQEFAKNCGIAQAVFARNGDAVRLYPGPVEIIDDAPYGLWLQDGRILARQEDCGIVERRKLGEAGAVSICIVIDKNGHLLAPPEFSAFGLPEVDHEGLPLQEVIQDALHDVQPVHGSKRGKGRSSIADRYGNAVRSAIFKAWRKKPIVKLTTIKAPVSGRR